MINVGTLLAVLRLKDEMTPQVHRARDELGRFTKGTTDKFREAGAKLASTGAMLTTRLTVPLAAAGAVAFKMSNDFNAAMANVGTLIPGNTARVVELKEAVQDMAIETGKSTDDLAGGLYQVVSAFGDTAESAEILRINAMAAAGGVASTTEAIDLTSLVTKNYGDTSAEAVKQAADLALMTVRLGQTDFPQLAASMGRVVPMAQAMGQSQEELFTVFATATGVTGSAAEVATQYRGVLAALADPTDALNELIRAQGHASGEAMLKQEGMVGTLQAIKTAAEQSGRPMTDYVSSIESLPLVLALAGPQADTFNQKLREMAGAAGAADAAFREQTTGVNEAGFAWQQFKAAVSVFQQEVGDTLAPVLLPILTTLRDWLGAFRELSPATQRFVVIVGAVAAALGPVLIAVGAMTTAIGAAMPVITAIIGVLSGPVGLAVALAAVALSFEPVRTALSAIINYISDRAIKIVQGIRDKFAELGEKLSWLKDKISGMLPEWARWGSEAEAASTGITKLGGGVKHLAPQLPPLADSTRRVADETRKLSEEAEKLPRIYAGYAPPITGAAEAFAELQREMKGLGEATLEFVTGPPSTLPGQLEQARLAADPWSKILGEAAPKIHNVGNASLAAAGGVDTLTDSVNNSGNALVRFLESLGPFASVLTNTLGSTISAILQGGSVGSAVANGLKQALAMGMDMVIPGLGTLAAPLVDAISKLFSGIFETANAASHAAEQFGFQLSQALADQIDRVAESFGGDLDAAIRATLDDIIREIGVTSSNFDDFVARIHQIFSSVDEGAFTTAEGIGHIGDALSQLIPQMAAAGGSAMDLQAIFSDMISRARAEGQDLGLVVIPTIQSAVDAMLAAGVEGVGELVQWLASLGVQIDGLAEPLSRAEQAWADWVETNRSGYQEATRHNRAYFEAIATEMGLTGETFDAWVNGMLRNQREAERERIKSNREMWRQQAIDAGLTGEQIKEYVDANIRQIRQAEREAAREARKERREAEVEQIESAKLVRDRQIHFIEQIGAAWSSMYAGAIGDAQSFAASVNYSAPAGTGGGRAMGSPGTAFEDFGAGTPMVLHGRETVVTDSQGASLAGMVESAIRRGFAGRADSGTAAEIAQMRNDLMRELPVAIGRAVKHAAQTGRR